jgi:hypothetical protein
MQQPPFRASELMELRRKPLTNNQNDSSGGERARVQMLEAEKKIAESLVATAITQKEILRLQTIKTVGLLKDQLAKTETILNNANDKIAFLEEERVRNKETLIENEVMSERLLEMEREIMSATQEHEAIVISMHFEREQFASRLFELEEQMSGEIATAHLAVELSIQERDADASSRCEIQSESNQMCATLQATVEHFKISESNLTNKIESLKLKLSAQIKVDAANKEEIIGLNKDLATTMSRLEIQTEVNVQSAALAAKKEIILQDAIKSAAALAEKECVLQDTITELRSVAEVYGEELVIAKKEVQVYEAQITILQVELEEKRSEASEMRNSTALRISALIALLEGEKDKVTYLEQRLGEFDETAELERKQRLIELKEHQDIQGMKDEESLQDMSSMRMAVVELNEKLSMTSAQLIEGQENVAKLQVALSTAVSASELSKLAFLDAEKQLQERLGLSCTEIDIVKGELEENEAKVAVLTVALTSYEDVCARLSHELSLMALEKDAIISKHTQELSALVEVMRASDTARAVSNERALALESAKAATEAEYKKLESIVQSHEAEILSLEIMRSNLSNSSGAQYSALVAQVRTKTAQIDELTLKLAAATAHQQAQGNELYLVLEEIQLEKTEMALKIDTLEACVASREIALAAAEAKAALSAEEVASRESAIRLITDEITELRAVLDDAQKELQLKIEEGKASEDTNSVLSDKCTSLKKKVTDMKLELLKIAEQVEAERNKWKEEVALCRQREEVQATATDNLLNTMNRLKEEVWGAFKIKLAEKEREIQGLTLQIEDAQKLKDEAELKTEEALCSLTAANEKCNTLQDEQIESEERQKMLDAASEESRITRENDLLKMQDELTERLSEAESENVSIAWALSILKSRKAESDEKLERALEELSAFEESRTDDLLVSAAIRSETEVAVLTVALAEARAEIESALLDSDDKIGCLTEALEESKKKIQMISSEIEGLRRKLEEAEAKNLSLEGALGDAEGKVASLLSESEDKIASLSIALTESRSTIESLSQAVELSERKASSLHSSLEQSKADNHEKALMISELTRLQTEIDAQLKLSRSNAERSPTKLPRSTTKSNSAQKKKLSIITSEEGNEKGTAGLDGGPVCSSLNISDKEFSHMQGEMRRFRYARDEAKVSMSKMAGRVAILKDQLQEKVRAVLSNCYCLCLTLDAVSSPINTIHWILIGIIILLFLLLR